MNSTPILVETSIQIQRVLAPRSEQNRLETQMANDIIIALQAPTGADIWTLAAALGLSLYTPEAA